jgi:hypothetical protein
MWNYMKYVIARASGSIEVLERKVPLTAADLRTLIGGEIAEFILDKDFEAHGPGKDKDLPALPLQDGGFALFKGVVVEHSGVRDLPENKCYPGFAGDIVLGASEGHIFRDAVFMGFPDSIAERAARHLTEKATVTVS